jgi:recombinational DNA repair ATPase RecF
VLSELDPDRRAILAARVRKAGGQALLTATSSAALPDAPDQLISVTPGSAVAA